MTLTATVTNVQKSGAKVFITFDDGTQLEFASLADAQAYALSPDLELVRKMGIARYLKIDPNANNPGLMIGHSITYTDTSNSMVVVS